MGPKWALFDRSQFENKEIEIQLFSLPYIGNYIAYKKSNLNTQLNCENEKNFAQALKSQVPVLFLKQVTAFANGSLEL
jgi:hypothetical protein